VTRCVSAKTASILPKKCKLPKTAPPPKKRYRPQKKRQLVLFKPKKAPQTSKNSQFGALAPTLVTLSILNCLLMENKGQIKE